MTGALLGLALGGGLLLAWSGWRGVRHPSLSSRVLPYVRDVHPVLAAPSATALGALLGPLVRSAADAVGEVVGGTASVRRRLVRLGSDATVDDVRVQQLLWGAIGFAVAALLSVLAWLTRGTSAPVLLVLCGLGFVAGVLMRDNRLSAEVREHERRMAEEFPVVADLLALSVAAGESPVSGLERISRVCRGSLGDEIGRVLAAIRTGTPVASAFDALASRTGVSSIARFAEGLAVAVERGTPLVDVLHSQAADVRESARRELMEAGGRKEIAMMLPVVFLILPVTVVFAFFPGYVGLRLVS